jgi:hypothetical protein
MDYLYKRVLSCELESSNGERKTFLHNIDEGSLFRIDFTAEFTGSATVSLYNVNEVTINMVKSTKVSGKTKFANLQLQAGYDKDIYLISTGEIVQSLVKRNQADKILELKISPKANLLTEYAIPKQYNGTLQTILKQFLLDNGILSYEILTLLGMDQIMDFASTGTVEQNLSRICKLLKAEYYLYLGKLVIATKDQSSFLKNQKVILDKESGLIGSPVVKGAGYTVKSLLNPKIAMNQVLEIGFNDPSDFTKPIKRDFIVKSGKHFGSSFSNDFYTEFDVIPK